MPEPTPAKYAERVRFGHEAGLMLTMLIDQDRDPQDALGALCLGLMHAATEYPEWARAWVESTRDGEIDPRPLVAAFPIQVVTDLEEN